MSGSFFKKTPEDLEFWFKNAKAFKPLELQEKIATSTIKQQKTSATTIASSGYVKSNSKKPVIAKIVPQETAKNINIHKNDLKKIKLNKIAIDAQLDLHNLTINEAYEQTLAFLQTSQNKKYKLVIIITGKGNNSKDKNNTIKSNFLNWLTTPIFSKYILQHSTALIKNGGDGAFYITIKKVKNNG